jgi:hypothetical protein
MLEDGIIEDLGQSRACDSDKGNGQGLIKLSEIKKNGLMRNGGNNKLCWKAVKKEHPEAFALS